MKYESSMATAEAIAKETGGKSIYDGRGFTVVKMTDRQMTTAEWPVYNGLRPRLERAFERRFGKSLLPLSVRLQGLGRWRVIDRETGSWADYELRGSRIRRTAELDNA